MCMSVYEKTVYLAHDVPIQIAMCTFCVQYWMTTPAALMLFGVTMRYLTFAKSGPTLREYARVYSLQDIIPSKRETERGVDEPCRVPRESLLVRQVRCHFPERHHDHVAYDSHEAVSQEDTKRPSAHEGSSGPDYQTCSNSTSKLYCPPSACMLQLRTRMGTYRYHGDLSRGQVSV